MNLINKIRNRALRKALDQFLEEKIAVKLPNVQKVNSILIILDEGDKGIVKNIESSTKALFGTNRCGFIILCNQMSDTILQSDLYTEITPKDFGFMSVLKPEKREYIKIYDLVIENPRGTDPVSNIHVLHNYLKVLAGPQQQNPY